MLTRRRLLTSAGLAAGAAFGETPDPRLASLKNRRDQAKPITIDERRARMERARELMRENKLDAICMIGGSSLVYFTNIHWWNSERFFAAVLPARGEPFYVCPAFEEDRAREQIASGLGGGNAHVLTWEEDDNPYRLLALGLKERGLSGGRLGIEETVPYVFSDNLAKAAPALAGASATPVTAGCRTVKSPQEMPLSRVAVCVTLQAYQAAWRGVRAGQ